MLETIKGLEVQGKVFTQKTPLFLFPNETNRIAVVFGRNGAGKSTIAEAFRMVRDQSSVTDISASMINQSNPVSPQPATGTGFDWNRTISVFDEQYIDENIKLNTDDRGLKTIVLFSDMASIDEQIQKKNREKANNIQRGVSLSDELAHYSDAADLRSPLNILDQIKTILRNDWANKDKTVKGNKVNTAVTEQVSHDIAQRKPRNAAQEVQTKMAVF